MSSRQYEQVANDCSATEEHAIQPDGGCPRELPGPRLRSVYDSPLTAPLEFVVKC